MSYDKSSPLENNHTKGQSGKVLEMEKFGSHTIQGITLSSFAYESLVINLLWNLPQIIDLKILHCNQLYFALLSGL